MKWSKVSEQYRAECEARYWLGMGFTTRSKTEQLREEIRKKRGQKAADYLIENMRKEWSKHNG